MPGRVLARAGVLLLVLLAIGAALSAYPAYLNGDLRYAYAGAVLVLAALLPTVRARPALRQVGTIAALLIALNLATTPWLRDAAPTLSHNYSARVEIVGDVMPGFTGVQTINTDEKGYRTNVAVDYRHKSPDTVRIFAVGASTTEQIALGNDKTWVTHMAALIEEKTGRRVEAVNTGVAGLRARHHLATLRQIEAYAPDLVIVMMGVNDWNRHIKTRGNPYFLAFYDVVEQFDLRESLFAQAYRGVHTILTALDPASPTSGPRQDDGSYFSRQNDSLNRPVQQAFFPREISENYRSHALRIVEFCRLHDLHCLLVDQATAYDPAIEPHLRKRLWMTPPNEAYTLTLENMAYIADLYNSSLREITASAGLPFCGISRQVPPTTASFYDDCHFNEPGARAVARLISDCILAQKLVH